MLRVVLFIFFSSLSGCLFFDSSASNPPKIDVSNDAGSEEDIVVQKDSGSADLCPSEGCKPDPLCGNNFVDPLEECDESAGPAFRQQEDTCSEVGEYQSGQLGCNACKFDFNDCNLCGDGVLNDAKEICDGQAFLQGASCGARDATKPGGAIVCTDRCEVDYTACRRGFTQVSVGEAHVCAIMTDKTVTCWGNDAMAPDIAVNKDFVEIVVGGTIACGRKKENNRVVCWNRRGKVVAAGGANNVKQMSAGPSHHCFLIGESVRCFFDEMFAASDGFAYSSITSGKGFACGLRTSGAGANGDNLFCWTTTSDNVPPTLAGAFTSLFAGADYVCGVPDSGAIDCSRVVTGIPSSPPSQIDAGLEGVCWLNADGQVSCHGLSGTVPESPFSSISVGNNYACGIEKAGVDQGKIHCWGDAFSLGSPGPVNNAL